MVQWQSQSSVNGLIDGIARKISPFANPDVVIALGGGTLIDNAAFYASSNHMAYITVLTSQATDVGLSPIASLYSPSDVKTSYVTGLPHTAVVDYVLLDSNAPLMNYAGIGDIVAKLTAVNDWNRSHAQPNQIEGNEFDPISALIATTLLQGLIHWARPSIDNREFLHQLYKTQLIAGYLMELAGCRRVAGGSEHQLAAEMEKMGETAPHGIVVGLCTYVVSKVQDDPAVHEAIKKFLQKTGFFEYLAQHGPHVSEQLLLQAINRCADPELKPGYHTVLLEPGKAQAAIQFVKSDPTIRPVLLKVQEVC
jgi:glycerol-1-phosphate dehydrogenase [NAD(P)+]